jgi:hypothetical protein
MFVAKHNFLAGTLEIGVALTAAALLLWVHLSLMEEYRSRVERVLSSPAGSRDACCNMRLSAALGAALFLTKGSCPETVAAWTSAFEIAESLDDADYRLRALWGMFIESITSRRYPEALALARKILRLCGAIGRPCRRASRRPSGRRGAACPG